MITARAEGWEWWLIGVYFVVLLVLGVFGLHRSWLIWQYRRFRGQKAQSPPLPQQLPKVLVQLPFYNERYVAGRLIEQVAALDYPREQLEIQVLDDSTDETAGIVALLVDRLAGEGVPIRHLRRTSREGYKAGALAWGLTQSAAELVAIFDADFLPPADFLRRTVGLFRRWRRRDGADALGSH